MFLDLLVSDIRFKLLIISPSYCEPVALIKNSITNNWSQVRPIFITHCQIQPLFALPTLIKNIWCANEHNRNKRYKKHPRLSISILLCCTHRCCYPCYSNIKTVLFLFFSSFIKGMVNFNPKSASNWDSNLRLFV